VAQVRRHEFAPAKLQVVPEWPLIYWWSENELDGYSAMPKILDFGGAKKGLCTGNDSRFLRLVWEVPKADVFVARFDDTHSGRSTGWSPAVYGAKSKEWFEPLELVLRWHDRGLELSQFNSVSPEHESHREPSVEFRRPGPSPWRHAQGWAQIAVDRPEGAPLPAYVPEHDPEPATDHLSNALGVALGRFGPAGEGILDPTKDSLAHALPAGILFLDGTLDAEDLRDSLGTGGPTAARRLEAARPRDRPGHQPRAYLLKNFFELHRKMYENRPIHWPLSSAAKTFVAYVTIHRWDASTLQ
jgi:hypothetical protein